MPSSGADESRADISRRTEPTIDGERLWKRLMTMAAIGRRGETGVDRPAFSLEDRAARRQLYEWGREHGLEATQDSIGNLFLRLPGRKPELPPILTGSHMDSQPSGGRFDGIYGVLAGLEALACLSDAGTRPMRSIEVVAWSNEEGGRFAPGAMGSQVFAGFRLLAELLTVRDESGTPLREALADTLAALPEAAIRGARASPAAYLEAHIEQGPRLEGKGLPVGVVTGIQGCLWLEFEVLGVAGHAGTTPHEFRRDALQGGMRLIDQLRSLCLKRSPHCRFTVGRLLVEPNTPNTIPGRVVFTVDFREAEPRIFDELCRMLREAQAPEAFGLKVRELFHHPPVVFSSEMTRIVAEAVASHKHPVFELVSGAFHDALFITALCPVGMMFIRCRDGISHNPIEFAEPADVTVGAEVLLSALLELSLS